VPGPFGLAEGAPPRANPPPGVGTGHAPTLLAVHHACPHPRGSRHQATLASHARHVTRDRRREVCAPLLLSRVTGHASRVTNQFQIVKERVRRPLLSFKARYSVHRSRATSEQPLVRKARNRRRQAVLALPVSQHNPAPWSRGPSSHPGSQSLLGATPKLAWACGTTAHPAWHRRASLCLAWFTSPVAPGLGAARLLSAWLVRAATVRQAPPSAARTRRQIPYSFVRSAGFSPYPARDLSPPYLRCERPPKICVQISEKPGLRSGILDLRPTRQSSGPPTPNT